MTVPDSATEPARSLRSLVGYSPLVDRPAVSWPQARPLAVWVVLNVEHYEFIPPPEIGRTTWDRVPAAPDVREYSFRDHSNRVGLWRCLEVFDRFGVRPTLSLNLAVLDLFPRIREEIVDRDLCVMSHGIFNTRYLFGLTPDEERAFYRDNIDSLRRHTGRELRGVLTPAVSNTVETPHLMAEAGLRYHADWVHDDQPVPLLVDGWRDGRRMISMPYSYDLNDAPLWDGRPYSGEYLVDSVAAQTDRLLADAERYRTGFVMCVALHPYQIGQPQHIGRLERMLERLTRDDRLWIADGDEIADHYLDHHYDTHISHLRASQAITDAR
jgi:allantoinase